MKIQKLHSNPHGRLVRRAIFSLFIGAVAWAAPVARAQYTSNYQTNTYDGAAASVNWTNGSYTVGNANHDDVLWVLNGAGLTNTGASTYGMIGSLIAGGSNNLAVVSGSGSLWTNVGAFYVGYSAGSAGNQLILTNGGRVVNAAGALGYNVSASNNLAVVSGSGSLWNNTAGLTVGNSGDGNQLIITNGGRVVNTTGAVGNNSSAVNNLVVVSGSGSLWTNTSTLIVGSSSFGNQLFITDGGRVVDSTGELGFSATASNNLAVVSGSGSLWNNTSQIFVGNGGSGNQLIITNGGQVVNTSSGHSYIGYAATASNNLAVVSGSGSLWTNAGSLDVGYGGFGNQLIITNGGRVVAVTGFIGSTGSASNNVLVVSDSGSIWNNVGGSINMGYGGSGNQLIVSNGGSVLTSTVSVGQTNGANGNAVRIESGGLLEANTLTMAPLLLANGNGNSITNFGGIFQFSNIAPTITTNATLGGGGSIVLTNGTIAFRNVNNVDVKNNWSGRQLTNILFQGANTFRLNMASNATSGQAYVFDQGRGATNYVGLEMINGGTAWRGGNLTIGSGGTMLVSNTTASVAGLFSNQGTVRVVNSVVAWSNNVVISGLYLSDPSTNTYITNVTVTASGALSGSNGDLFVFYQNLAHQSTNRAQFDLSRAAVLFSNGVAGVTNHTFDMTGSGAVDMGSSWLNVTQLATNFSIGTLSIASGNRLTLMGTNFSSGFTNALYVGWLDLETDLSSGTAVSNALLSMITLTNLNLYYDASDARNAYLQDASYDLWFGGGLLIPIPEPSTAGLILGGALFSAWLLRRKRNEN